MAAATSSRGLTAPVRTMVAWATASAQSMASPTIGRIRQARRSETVYDRGMAIEDLDLFVDADDESFETMAALAIAHGWGDGLPLVPPTESRVATMLGDRDADEVLGVLPPRRSEVTTLAVAVNAVMAGCPTAAFPAVTTAVRALCHPAMNLEGVQATTHPVAPLVIVHGELVRRGGFNAGLGAFGPGNASNAAVGRAIRLVLMHLGDARPGNG